MKYAWREKTNTSVATMSTINSDGYEERLLSKLTIRNEATPEEQRFKIYLVH